MGSPLVQPPVAKAKALYCPNCGGPVELRGFGHALSVVCPQCLTVLDASTPLLKILQTSQILQRTKPIIPLGSRGKFDATFEAIGFQVRTVQTDESSYSWEEYLLFNPYQGFRYLTQYNGHWNFVKSVSALPEPTTSNGRKAVRWNARVYQHFDSGVAETTFVLGEFPWRVKVGERVSFEDYISPPSMLSSEGTGTEVTWSEASYQTGDAIWQAFKLPGSPPAAVGIFANQPVTSSGQAFAAWATWAKLMAVWLLVLIYFLVSPGRKQVFDQKYSFTPGGTSEPSFVTSPFQLSGGNKNLQIEIDTNLKDDWAYFNLALVNEDTAQARDFGREVAHEGNTGRSYDKVVLHRVTPGKYYLRVEPEKEAGTDPMNFEVKIVWDVPRTGWLWLAALLLLIPPIIISFRGSGMEAARWRESDYG